MANESYEFSVYLVSCYFFFVFYLIVVCACVCVCNYVPCLQTSDMQHGTQVAKQETQGRQSQKKKTRLSAKVTKVTRTHLHTHARTQRATC